MWEYGKKQDELNDIYYMYISIIDIKLDYYEHGDEDEICFKIPFVEYELFVKIISEFINILNR